MVNYCLSKRAKKLIGAKSIRNVKENQEIENFLNALLIILLSPVHGFLQYLTKKERGF